MADSQLEQQRVTFQLAKKALETNQISKFKKLNNKLQGYPLQPYLDYLYLRHRLSYTNEKTISHFLQQQQGTFYAKRLRSSWLNSLARERKWSLFLAHYQSPQSVSRQCLQVQALINTDKQSEAIATIPSLWLVPRSQHKNCDPIFTFWEGKNLLTDDLRLQRIMLAVHAKQFSLAKYLAKPLKHPQATNALISAWQQANDSPQQFLNSKITDNKNNRDIIKHAIYRLARKSTDQAYEAWQKLSPNYKFSEQDKLTAQRAIANRAALNREDRTLEYFSDIPNEAWRVRAALWQQDWQAVNKAVLSLNLNERQQPRWQYWLARSQAKLGQHVEATKTYQSLISKRDFYGFLAADQLQQPYQMNHKPIYYEQAEIDLLLQHPAVARLKEFFTLDMDLAARRQAYSLKQQLSPRELQLLATLTHKWQWHNQTIALLGKAKYWDALNLRFPLVYNSPILLAAKKNGIDPSWLLGIVRQESAFNSHARSHVGATGLMQLMPKTAKQIARLINKPLKNTSELLIPERNIQLGSAYLRRMYDKNQQNPVLATASYNAGPHRVARWLPEKTLPADIWIENIPFTETRHYTQAVLSYAAIFDYQRKQTIKPLSTRMPAVQAKEP
ncbi:transglycosylase SLT domain-containing protein [Pseudomonadota bacterium]|nr:transglycosylase SLT domain-containing protein [Pseudomonadota bacterium]